MVLVSLSLRKHKHFCNHDPLKICIFVQNLSWRVFYIVNKYPEPKSVLKNAFLLLSEILYIFQTVNQIKKLRYALCFTCV